MSTCWKCGQPVPEGTAECEYGCTKGVNGHGHAPKFFDPEARAKMAEELERLEREAIENMVKLMEAGNEAAINVARCLKLMGAAKASRVVVLDGEEYLVFVKRIPPL